MIRFECDYAEGAHPRLLQALVNTNFEQHPGYSEDTHCDAARAIIREQCAAPQAAVHFLVGGTQANLTVIASVLRPYQGVLCADAGHINVHETGAIEATGHRVMALPSPDGKVRAEQVAAFCAAHRADATFEHTVQPGMVYISLPTEGGLLYSLDELQALHAVCRENGLPLFIDGARLGFALAADKELTLASVAASCDVFYIGGTKVGALFGEAVVIVDPALQRDFRYMMKQRGGMLAKGRLLGVQFEELLRDGLYMEIGQHAVSLAARIRDAFAAKGFDFLFPSFTNQQFPILTRAQADTLAKKYVYSHWADMPDGRVAVRFCTGWATKEADVDALIADIEQL